MFKKLKLNGFSLVEVMILFTVLSVILAASVSMITKKTISPSQNKVSHGVYRCIALPNGNYRQELYNGSRRVESRNVSSCSFRVPKAAMYKVDLYSAGSGGTEQAYISSSISGSSANASYTLDSMTNSTQNQLFIPTDNDLYRYFAGKYYVNSVYTGDAGFGGGIKFTYPSVIDSSCIDGDADKKIISDRIKELKATKAYLEGLTISSIIQKANIGGWDSVPSSVMSKTYPQPGSLAAIRGIIPHCSIYARKPDDCDAPTFTPHIMDTAFSDLYKADHALARLYVCEDGEDMCDYDAAVVDWNKLGSKVDSLFKAVGFVLFTITDETFVEYVLSESLNENCPYGKYYTYKSASAHSMPSNSYIGKAVNNQYEKRKEAGLTDSRIEYDDDGGDNQDNSAHNLSYYGLRRFKNEHAIFGTLDDDGNESWTWGINFKYVVDDIFEEAKRYAIEDIDREIERWEKMTDLPQNGFFMVKGGSPGAYNERSVLTFQAKQQMFDYCKLMFKPFYEYTGRYNRYDSTTTETGLNRAMTNYKMSFGGTRMVVKPGGKEGLGRMLVMIYQIGSGNGGGKSFKSYAESIKSTHKPVQCKENNSAECENFEKIEKGTDANLLSAITYSPGTNSIGKDEILKVEYDYDQSKNNKNTSLKIEGSNRYAVTSDGGNLADVERKITKKVWSIFNWMTTTTTEYTKPYVLWEFPEYEGGYIAVTRSLATGGTGPKVYVDESNTKTYTFPERTGGCNKTDWTCGPNSPNGPSDVFYRPWPGGGGKINVAYTANADTAVTDGANTLLNGLARSAYRILPMEEQMMANVVLTSMSPSQSPFKQEPRLHTKSWIWTKSYKLGASGNTGSLKSTVENDLGDNCTFNVAKPGQKYRPKYDDVDVLNKRLTTSMTCTSRGKKTLYLESPPNTYNTVLKSGSDVQNNSYTWNSSVNENGGSQNVTLKNSAPATSWTPTSMWSRVFNNNVIKNGVYDIKLDYHVGEAGAGTQLKDSCLARKGKYQTSMDYYITYPKNPIINRYRTTTNTNCLYVPKDSSSCNFSSTFTYSDHSSSTRAVDIDNSSETKYAPGKYKGFNCYGTNDSNTATTDEMYINADDPIVVNGIMQMSAGDGGGGAVVITW